MGLSDGWGDCDCVYGDEVKCIRFHLENFDHMAMELIELKEKERNREKKV